MSTSDGAIKRDGKLIEQVKALADTWRRLQELAMGTTLYAGGAVSEVCDAIKRIAALVAKDEAASA